MTLGSFVNDFESFRYDFESFVNDFESFRYDLQVIHE